MPDSKLNPTTKFRVLVASGAAVIIVALSLWLFLVQRPFDRADEPAPPTPENTARVTEPPAASPTPSIEPSPESSSPAASSSPSAPYSTPPPPNETGKTTDKTQKAQIATANEFVDVWLTKGTEKERLKRLEPVTSPDLAKLSSKIDNRNLPEAERIGDAALDESRSDSQYITAHVKLSNGEAWTLILVLDPSGKHGWKVFSMDGDAV